MSVNESERISDYIDSLEQQLGECQRELRICQQERGCAYKELAECRAAQERAEAEAASLYKQRIDSKLDVERLMAERARDHRVAQRCPVCSGCGTVPPYFYDYIGYGSSVVREMCRACAGTGLVWG